MPLTDTKLRNVKPETKQYKLLMVLRRIESRGALDTAHRTRSICGRVFKYAVATGRAKRNAAADLQGAIPSPKTKHLAAITEPEKVAGLLKAIDAFEGGFITKCALHLVKLPGRYRRRDAKRTPRI